MLFPKDRGPDLHIVIWCNASPISTTLPSLLSPSGGTQSNSSSVFISVPPPRPITKPLNGSAHVCANERRSSTRAGFVSGNSTGSGRPKKPGRVGHETTSWQVYFCGGAGRLFRDLDLGLGFVRLRLLGASRTGLVSAGKGGRDFGGPGPGWAWPGKVFRIGDGGRSFGQGYH